MPLKSMVFVHLLLALFCALLLAAALATAGLFGPGMAARDVHLVLGLLAAVAAILSHSLASFYLIETGINLKRAVRQRGLDLAYIARTRELKQRVFPFAFWAMVMVGAAAVLGGAADSGAFPLWVHQALVAVAVPVSLTAWGLEAWAIKVTRALIHQVNQEMQAKPEPAPAAAEPAAESPAPRPIAVREALWLLGRWITFVALSLWILYGYLRLVVRMKVAVWPFAAAFLALLAVGLVLLARYSYADEDRAGAAEREPSPSRRV